MSFDGINVALLHIAMQVNSIIYLKSNIIVLVSSTPIIYTLDDFTMQKQRYNAI